MSAAPIAITGMACLFPGAADVGAYWSNILGSVDATSDPPPEAWDPDVYYDPDFSDQDKTYCKRGGYLGSLATFDPLAYGVAPVSVGGEPDQWLALRMAHAALGDAGALDLPAEVRERTAIILGKGTYLNGGNAIAVQRGLVVGQTIGLLRRLHPEHSEEYLESVRAALQAELPPLGPETVPGLIPNIIVGRIANRLDLMGPAYTVDAACASSLVAIDHAVRGLQSGDTDLALAGGAQVWMPVATLNLFCRLGALSRRQQLRAFDKDADGTLLGEGIGMVVLRRLEDALAAGDRVYALIRGVGVASDGRGAGVMAPRVEGETLALRRAYERAGVSPESIGLLEAHGTGTSVGDAAEVEALRRVFGDRTGDTMPRVALGTVKSMIGHTIPAAGVAGVIKAALALHHRVLPPTLHVETPNPKLELERTRFYLNTATRPWIHGGKEPRRAGVNAFGFGGINAHAVLEEHDSGEAMAIAHAPARDSELCLLACESAGGLADLADELAAVIDGGPSFTLAELAAALSGEPHQSGARLGIVASSLEDLGAKLASAATKLREPDCRRIRGSAGIYYEREPLGPAAKVVLVFPGEGSQYQHMLADLCLNFAEARDTFDRIDRLYLEHPRGHVLSDWVFPRPAYSDAERRQTESRLMDLDVAVESVLTANAAVHAVLRRLVGRIDAMVGHSTGEHSAAIAANALDLSSDRDLEAFCHGLHASYAEAAGRHDVPAAVLLAVGAGAEEVAEIAAQAGGELHVAMDNCPHQAVLVGEPEAAERACVIAVDRGLMCEVLPYDRAVHTPSFAPFAADLEAIFAGLPISAPAIPLWSCTTASPYPADPQEIRELMVEHWTSPVLFRSTIENLYEDGARVFIESGPRGNMTSFIEDILRGRGACAVAADVRRRSTVTQLNHLAGMLFAHEVPLDPGYLSRSRALREIDWRAPAQPQPGTDGPRIALSTRWPMLRLSRGVPTPPGGANGGSPSAAVAAVDATVTEAIPAGPQPAAALANAHAAEPALPVAWQEAATPAHIVLNGHHGTDRDGVLDGHVTLMGQFLASGADVMRAYMPSAALTAPAAPPLLGTIVHHDPERELTAQRVIDLREDRYLLDHTFGRSVSREDPDLPALVVMPLAMSLELVAEAAAALFPALTVTALHEVRGHRWLIAEEDPTTVELTARAEPAAGAGRAVRATLAQIGEDGSRAQIAEALVLLGAARPAPPARAVPAPQSPQAARWRAGELYSEAMFHGPLWQGVSTIDAVGADGAAATLVVPPRSGLLRGSEQPAFVLDPVLLDAAGQLVGFWAAQVLASGRVVFPFRAEAIELFGAPPVEGEAFDAVAAITLDGEQLVRSDIDVIDASGGCRLRIKGWEDKRFDVPGHLEPLTGAGRLAQLSSRWDGPLASLGPYVTCRRMSVEIGSDAALWRQVWAKRVLSRRERAHFAQLAFPQRRRDEWLAGRTAAKEAVAELIRVESGADVPLADIEILPEPLGRPSVVAPALDGLRAVVSISHAGGQAAALAALVAEDEEESVGFDIEPLGQRPAGFHAAALSERERRLLADLPADVAERWHVRCWCAREAAGKAAGSGVVAGAGAPAVVSVDAIAETVEIEIHGQLIRVHTREDAGFIVAATRGAAARSAA